MKNHQFSSRLLFIFFGIMSISYFAQLIAGRDPLFYVYLICIVLLFLPALYMHLRARQLKKKLDEEEMRRQLAEREWSENQQRMQWNAAQQWQHNTVQQQHKQNVVQQQKNNVQQQQQQNTFQHQQQQQNAIAQQQRRNTAPPQPKAVTCTGCGARTTILPEESKNCDYCGFSLSYPPS